MAIECGYWPFYDEIRDFMVKSVYPSMKSKFIRLNHIQLKNQPLNEWI